MKYALRLLLVLCLLAAVPLAPGRAALAENKPPVIAVINYALAISNSKAGKSVRDQVAKRRAIYQVEVKKAQTRLEDARQELMQQQAVLSPEAFQRKRQEFQVQADQLQRTAQSRTRTLDKMRAEGIRQIEEVLREILGDMAKEEGYDIIMNAGPGAGTIVIASKELFITERVLEKLDKKLPEVVIKAAAE